MYHTARFLIQLLGSNRNAPVDPEAKLPVAGTRVTPEKEEKGYCSRFLWRNSHEQSVRTQTMKIVLYTMEPRSRAVSEARRAGFF